MRQRTIRTTRHSKQNAQGLVEFALILPVLLLLIFGIIDFGWMVFNYAQLYNSLREGVRYGSVTGYTAAEQYKNCAGIKDMIVSHSGWSGIQASNIIIVYDDGRPFTDFTTYTTTHPTSQTAYCNMAASPPFQTASWHVGTEPAPNTTGQRVDAGSDGNRDLINSDRIVIQINVNVQFLTPIIRSFAKSGMNVTITGSRTIFPSGLVVGSG